MASYISSNNNRFYTAVEAAYGNAAPVTAQSRIPAVRLQAAQKTERPKRRDKTGTRGYPGDPAGLRRSTAFGLTTYMTAWDQQTQPPPHAPLFQAALGGAPQLWSGGTVTVTPGSTAVSFAAPHGMAPGQAITVGGEMRFVAAVTSATAVVVNAPFVMAPPADATAGPTTTFHPANALPSVTVYDYWDPATALQRVLVGAAVNQLDIKVNGDYHEFQFTGQAADLLDSVSFTAGQGGLGQFPAEPAVGPFDYTIIPGHLGEVWLGAIPNQFLTVTAAEVSINNALDLRVTEFGSMLPRATAAGNRKVSFKLSLYEMDDQATQMLYQAARQRSPMAAMLQLGNQAGELFGVYIQSVIPEVPEFEDREVRLQWKFGESLGQGANDNDIFVAFG
jgi:hypothetical protein